MGTKVFKSFRELWVGEVREKEKMCGMYWPIIWVAAENLSWKCRFYQLVHLRETKRPTFHFNMALHIPNRIRPMRGDSSAKHQDVPITPCQMLRVIVCTEIKAKQTTYKFASVKHFQMLPV